MVASRRSGVMRTSGMVTRWPSSTGSCTSPRVSISESAWRTNSPTRSCRWEAPACSRVVLRFVMGLCERIPIYSIGYARGAAEASTRALMTRRSLGRQRFGKTCSQAALDRLDPVAFDDVADLHVLVVFEGHAAFLSGHHLAGVVLEALE